MPVIAEARQTVAAPVRRPRPFGLFSVLNPIDDSDAHWIMGGLTADGEECSKPLTGGINCGPSPDKQPRSWYSDIDGDPFLTYMYETCKTVGRVNESAARLRTRFLAAEQSAVERALQAQVLDNAPNFSGGASTVTGAIAYLEQAAAEDYGGQIILHLPMQAAEEAVRQNVVQRVGDHLETGVGNLVVAGNYQPDLGDGDVGVPVIYGTGTIDLHRGPLVESGPVLGGLFTLPDNEGWAMTNDYYTLIERPYAALIDCWWGQVTAPLCDCGGGGGPI